MSGIDPQAQKGISPACAYEALNANYSSPFQEKEFSTRVMYTVARRASDGAHPAEQNGGSKKDFGKRSFAEVSVNGRFGPKERAAQKGPSRQTWKIARYSVKR